MVRNTDILNAVTKKLNDKFNYKIYLEETDEKVVAPTFVVTLSLLGSETFKYWNEKTLNIYITYTNLNAKIEELANMENELDSLFGMYLNINGYNMVFNNKKFSKPTDSITMSINVDFIDCVTFVMPQETSTSNSLMENLNLNIK